jgi:tRNA pseudouridine38-40 synthase
MTVEYDGSQYVGWQRQKNGVSVQQRVEEALSGHLREKISVTAAGRTDSGVHAIGQVINFHTISDLPVRAIWKGSLQLLPKDITFTAASNVSSQFNARRCAKLRWYRYFILNRSVWPAVASTYLTFVPYRLDMARMELVAETIAGHHDFRAFRAKSCTATRTHLTMRRPRIAQEAGGILIFDFRCQSFLQNMVRILVGIMIECGRGRMQIEQVRQMLQTGERAHEAVTLSPNGLFLYKVLYDGDEVAKMERKDAPSISLSP